LLPPLPQATSRTKHAKASSRGAICVIRRVIRGSISVGFAPKYDAVMKADRGFDGVDTFRPGVLRGWTVRVVIVGFNR